MTHYVFTARWGDEITKTIRAAIACAGFPASRAAVASQIVETADADEWAGDVVEFDFNDVRVLVCADSDPDLILRDWGRAMARYIEGPVGPYPPVALTEAEVANDARLKAEADAREAERAAAAKAKADAKLAATTARLAEAPEFDIANPDVWAECLAKNTDPYGARINSYAQDWARLMQLDMSRGAELEDVADATSHEADTDGITGFMYGAAVATLAAVWVHGDRLRRWHNKEFGAPDAEGTVNPALLTVGSESES